MAWTLLSWCVVLGLLLESRRRLLDVRALWSVAGPFLQAARRPQPSESEQRIHVAELNEATLEIGAGLARAGVPRRCARAAVSLGALVALLEAAERVRGDGSQPWLAPALALLGGCVGALGCVFIGRVAEGEARRLRADWATLIRRSTRDDSWTESPPAATLPSPPGKEPSRVRTPR